MVEKMGRTSRAERSAELRRAPPAEWGLLKAVERARGAGRRGGVVGGRGFKEGGWSYEEEEVRVSAAMAGGGAAAAARARQSERGRADGRKWKSRERRARPGAPGGRPGRVQVGA